MDNIENDIVTEGDGMIQSEPTRCSARTRRSPTLFNPGTGPVRNWSLDIVVNEALILNDHARKFPKDEPEEIFVLST
eukprot:10052661-Ditylum_brightwellii.AAC.1